MSNWKRVALMSGVMALLVGCKSRKEVLPLVEVVEMPEDQIEQALSGVTYAELENAWGSPVAELSGMDGEVFDLGSDNGNLTVYYGNDDRSVVAVSALRKKRSLQKNPCLIRQSHWRFLKKIRNDIHKKNAPEKGMLFCEQREVLKA